jgi:hypothetical protein
VITAALTIDGGELLLLGQVHVHGCISAIEIVRVPPAGLPAAATQLLDRLGDGKCVPQMTAETLLTVPEVARPRDPPPPLRPRPPKKHFWERPWLWAGLVAVASVVVGVTAATVSAEPSYSAKIDARAFSLTRPGAGRP